MDIELARYLVTYYSHLLSGREQLLIKHAKSDLILSQDTLTALLKDIGWVEPSIDTSQYFNTDTTPIRITNNNFDMLIASKILEKHTDEVYLNYCPKCQRLARTPQSKQCRCGYNWRS